jgi:hypothetical protein
MRRRATGLTLAGLAAFLAASAVILGWRIAGQATERSLSEHETVTLTAARASYFSPVRLREITGAAIVVTDTITAVRGAVSPAIAIWNVHESVYDATNRQPLEPMSRTVVFDRGTAELVNCCGGNIDGDGLIWQDGIAGYAFPVGTRKQTYYVFDTVLDKPEPFAYSGMDTVDGIPAYRFAEDVSAAKAGFSSLSSADPQAYSVQRVYWVDPETGMLLKVSEKEDLSLVNPATGSAVTRLFRADLHTTTATVERLASQDVRERDDLALMASARLALFVTACGLALLAGCLLARGPGPERLRRLLPSRSPDGQ